MKTLFINSLFFFFPLFATQALIGQCEDIILSNQTEIDNFFANYGCTEIDGHLNISGADIHNLEGLSMITSISESFSIDSCPMLEKIIGWDNLSSIGEELIIANNNELSQILGFKNLNIIGDNSVIGGLVIRNNEDLLNVLGFNELTKIYGNLEIKNNLSLENIYGFSKLETIQTSFEISDNISLLDIVGFQELTKVSGPFSINLNPSLQNPTFNKLRQIYGDFHIRNTAFTDMSAFSSLELISGIVFIDSAWPDLSGLNSLSKVSTLHFWNSGYKNLEGLFPNLIEVNQLIFEENPQLEKIADFDNLQIVYEGILILGNPQLESLSGFSNLQSAEFISILGCQVLKESPYFPNLKDLVSLKIAANNSLETLSGFNDASIEELSIINNDKLHKIEAFKEVEQMSNVSMHYNDKLEDLSGFSNLKELTGALIIANNNAIKNLSVFSNLESVDRVSIGNNNALEDLGSFEQMHTIKSLSIYTNENLREINGFNNLSGFIQTIHIANNPVLEKISGFNNLFSILSSFKVHNNPQLKSIEGFNSLVRVSFFSIEVNPMLTHLPDLPQLGFITDDLNISNNESLETCCPAICWAQMTNHSFYIDNNHPNCSSLPNIANHCPSPSCNTILENGTNLLSASPSPAKDYLNVNLSISTDFGLHSSTELSYEIWNMSGQLITQKEVAIMEVINFEIANSYLDGKVLYIQLPLDVKKYPSGIYLFRLFDPVNEEIVFTRFLKE